MGLRPTNVDENVWARVGQAILSPAGCRNAGGLAACIVFSTLPFVARAGRGAGFFLTRKRAARSLGFSRGV